MTVIKDCGLHGGSQVVHRFENNFGASVVCHDFSYGGEEGLFELAVIRFSDSTDKFSLTYDTEITDDVIGNLTGQDVENLLNKIEQL